MRGIPYISALLLGVLVVASGCLFKPQPFRGVVSYRDGKVYLKPGRYYNMRPPYYRVGVLAADWERMKTRARTISWHNESYKSSISTDAYCNQSVEGRSLASLSGDLITALDGRRFTEETQITLAGRAALRQVVEGSFDGVPVQVDIVVVRKDGCVFDFYLVSPGNPLPEVVEDFEAFFGGFEYE